MTLCGPQPLPRKGEEGLIPGEGCGDKLVHTQAPAAGQAFWPGSHECERSRTTEDRARGGDRAKRGCVRTASCLWLGSNYCRELGLPEASESAWRRQARRCPGARDDKRWLGTQPGASPSRITCGSAP